MLPQLISRKVNRAGIELDDYMIVAALAGILMYIQDRDRESGLYFRAADRVWTFSEILTPNFDADPTSCSMAEMGTGIFGACLPTFRPSFQNCDSVLKQQATANRRILIWGDSAVKKLHRLKVLRL